ncbi:hypothetical protein ACHAXS_012794 [Conticribra weissflogii]
MNDDSSHHGSPPLSPSPSTTSSQNTSSRQQKITASLASISQILQTLQAHPESTPFLAPVEWKSLQLYDYPKIIKKMMDLGTISKKLSRGKYKCAGEVAEDIRLVWRNCKTYNADGSDFYLLAENFSEMFEEEWGKVVKEFGEGVVWGMDEVDNIAEGDADGGAGAAAGSSRHSHPGGRKGRSNSFASSGRTTPLPENSNTHANTTPSSGYKSDRSFNNHSNNNNNNNNPDFTITSENPYKQNIVPLDIRTRFAARLQRLSGMELGHVLSVIDTRCPEALEDPSPDSLPSGAPYPMQKTHHYSWDPFDGGCQLEIDVDAIPVEVFRELDTYVKEKVQGRGKGAWSDEIWSEFYEDPGSGGGTGEGGKGSIRGRKRKHKSL